MGEIVLGKMKNLCKKETVFCVSFMLALLSMLFVTPDLTYLNYPDYRTLSLLFSLMIVVAGLQSLGIFERLGNLLMRRAKGAERLTLTLILLCDHHQRCGTDHVRPFLHPRLPHDQAGRSCDAHGDHGDDRGQSWQHGYADRQSAEPVSVHCFHAFSR